MISTNVSGVTAKDIAGVMSEAMASNGFAKRGGIVTFTFTLGDDSCLAIFCINVYRALWLDCEEDLEEVLSQIKTAIVEIVRDVKKELR